MDDDRLEKLEARVANLERYVALQTGQVPVLATTRSLQAQAAATAVVSSIPAGELNPGPYRVYRMNVPALPEGVDPEGEAIWQVIGLKGVSTGFVGSHPDADAEAEKLNKEMAEAAAEAAAAAPGAATAPAAFLPPGPANPGPYTHRWTLSGLWHVFGVNGIHTGFSGTQEGAENEAKRLNGAIPSPPAPAAA